jgi:hypothetical protein
MPCVQVSPGATPLYLGVHSFTSGPHATEEDCLNACKEGACCNGTTCAIRPKCECDAFGYTFKGFGTKCSPIFGECPASVCTDCCSGGFLTAQTQRTLNVSTNLVFSTTCGGTNYQFSMNQIVTFRNRAPTGASPFFSPCNFIAGSTYGHFTPPSPICSMEMILEVNTATGGGCTVRASVYVTIALSGAAGWALCEAFPLSCPNGQSGVFVQYGQIRTQAISIAGGCMSDVSIPIVGTYTLPQNGNPVVVRGALGIQPNPLP